MFFKGFQEAIVTDTVYLIHDFHFGGTMKFYSGKQVKISHTGIRELHSRVTFTALAYECMLKMLRQKQITAFFCEKNGVHVQRNQFTSSESVNLAASAKLEDLDEDNSIQNAAVTERTSAKRRKLKDHQGNSIAELQCKFII